MAHTRCTTPSWNPHTLRKKRDDHAACFADILGMPLARFPPGKFEILADDCYAKHWLAYEADCRDKDTREYVGPRHYFVDQMLGLAVTTNDETRFVTYFHEDFDLSHGVRPPRNASAGQRELEYRAQLEVDKKSTKIRYVKILPSR
jgi:hypothetical protein